jgi:hypothetical protein
MKARVRNFILIEIIFFFLFLLIAGLSTSTQTNSTRSEKNKTQELVITYQFRELDLSSTEDKKCEFNSDVFTFIPSIKGAKVCIPFKNYKDKKFPILIDDIKNNDELRIKLIDSRTFYVERNSLLVYTHRYQEPVFYFEPIVLNEVRDQLGLRVDIKEKLTNHDNRLANLQLFLLFTLILGNSWLLTGGYQSGQRRDVWQKFPEYFYLAIGSLWVSALLAWYFGPRDSIGSSGRSPFGPTAPLFSDFFQIAQSANYRNPYLEGAVNYPAFATLVLKCYGNLFTNSLLLLILSLSVSMFILLYRNIVSLHSLNWLHSLLLGSSSFPILYGLFRGNLDVLVSVLVIASFYFWDKTKSNIASIILLGIAILLKVWPVFFLLPLLKLNKYREVLWTTFISILLTSFSTLIYSGFSFSRFILIIISSGESKNTGDISEFSFSYSLRPILGGIYHLIKFGGLDSNVERLGQVFAFLDSKIILFILMISLVLVLSIILKLKTFNAVYLYAASIPLLFFSPSYSYRAIPIVFYFYLLVTNRNGIELLSVNKPSRISVWEWLSFALLLAPSTVFFFPGTQISMISIFQPMGLLVLMFFAFLRANTNRLTISSKSYS